MTVPSWVADSIFYQIFPDRFANGDISNDPPNVQPWDSSPTNWGFHGGDFRGILQHFDHLLNLGITAIYLNPIFHSSSNHRYNTFDYFKIDPKLGDMNDFQNFLDLAHRNNIHVLLDGVFNHCGRGFFAFNDLLENEKHSAYKDWFHTSTFPLDAFSPGDAINYEAWWKLKSLPKFNTNNLQVRKFLLDVSRYWIERGIDGWRLDVPNEIDDDSFWEEFREIVLRTNKDAYLLGEIWTADPRWVNEKHFDGLMNYPLRETFLNLIQVGEAGLLDFVRSVEELISIYPHENTYSMYNFLGTHDTERLFTKVGFNTLKAKLAFLLLFSIPGVPSIYYGDEVGLQGEKDPDCRRTFSWDQSTWNLELYYWVQSLVSLRKKFVALRHGDFGSIFLDKSKGIYAFSRGIENEKILVVMNVTENRQQVKIPVSVLGWQDGRRVTDIFTNHNTNINGNLVSIDLLPWSGTWIS